MWPEEKARVALAEVARACGEECGGRPVPAANIHLTLAFLGEVNLERVPEISALPDAIRGFPFDLTFDVRGYWRHNRIVWMGTTQTPAQLRELAMQLAQALRLRGLRHETREYVPHITLLRDARRTPRSPQPAPIAWRVDEFVLVRSTPSRQTSAYEIVQRWPLRTPPPG